MESVTLSLPEAYDLALEVLSANGFSADHAAAIARNVTAGERDGCASHGLWRLLGIVDTLRKGKVSPDAEPQIHDQAPGIARADAGGAFSLLAYERALPLLLEKARHNGIAALAINRCVHFSALFADIEPLTEAGLVDEIAPALSEALDSVRPAATMVVAGLIRPEMKVEIEVTAFKG